jgi:N-acetylneuraminic acid mutarotase
VADYEWSIDDPRFATIAPNGPECTVTAKAHTSNSDVCSVTVSCGNRISSCKVVNTAEGTHDSWVYLAERPYNAEYMQVTSHGKYKIYVFGGSAGTPKLNYCVCYDLRTNIWQWKTSMPGALAYGSATSVGKKIYLIGYGSNNWCYDTVTDTWEIKTGNPTGIQYSSAVNFEGKIYVMGGGGTANQCYDPATDTWEQKAPIPSSMRINSSIVFDKKIYCTGNKVNKTTYGTTYCYDTATDTWERKADNPARNANATMGIYDGKICAIAGEFDNYRANNNQWYDPVTNTWETKTASPQATAGNGGMAMFDEIYVNMGYNGGYHGYLLKYTP